VVVALVVGAVIIGGIKSIARVTEKVVPFMAIIYCGAGLIIILANFTQIPAALAAIFTGAFAPEGVVGGAVGALIQGFRRAAFSNEAGIGSASIAHSAVRTKEPITEGLVALHEPFIDTVVICTMTALVIVITGSYTAGAGMGGVELTSAAFASVFPWFPYVLALAVILFAFSTMISWSYYGAKCWTYLFGESRSMDLLFKLIFCIFVVIGSSMSLGPVVDLSDSAIFAMAIANIIGLYILFPVVKRELDSYWSRLRAGQLTRYRTSWLIHVD
jgi:AGCS family alanine or glycine:cation symporter